MSDTNVVHNSLLSETNLDGLYFLQTGICKFGQTG